MIKKEREFFAKTISATKEDFKFLREAGDGSLSLGVRRCMNLWKSIEAQGNVKIDKEYFAKDLRSKK